MANAVDAQGRSAEGGGQALRYLDVVDVHIVQQRAVAEQHVHQLAGIAADAFRAQRDPREAGAVGLRLDGLDPSDDIVKDAVIGHGRERHLDALFERERLARALPRPPPPRSR